MSYAEDLQNRFTYHPPLPGQPERYEEIRQTGMDFAWLIERECPDSREKSLAITKIEEAVFWANAAIARWQQPTPVTSSVIYSSEPLDQAWCDSRDRRGLWCLKDRHHDGDHSYP